MHIIFSLAFCGYSTILVQRDYKNLEILCYKKLQYIIIYNQLIFLLYIMREYVRDGDFASERGNTKKSPSGYDIGSNVVRDRCQI